MLQQVVGFGAQAASPLPLCKCLSGCVDQRRLQTQHDVYLNRSQRRAAFERARLESARFAHNTLGECTVDRATRGATPDDNAEADARRGIDAIDLLAGCNHREKTPRSANRRGPRCLQQRCKFCCCAHSALSPE